MASGATCVQRLDGSRDSAIHTKYRISLRSSSMREPRYPLPRVVLTYKTEYDAHPDRTPSLGRGVNANSLGVPWRGLRRGSFVRPRRLQPCIDGRCVGCNPPDRRGVRGTGPRGPRCVFHGFAGRSAGQVSKMILPQVHLRKPCYDFSFL